MPNSMMTVASSVTGKLVHEFKHAPLGTMGAVVAIADVAWRLIEGASGGHPISNSPPTPPEQHVQGFPAIVPYLQFLVFQIAIAYLLHWSNALFSSVGIGIRICVVLLTTVVAAYLTDLNAFQAARFMIEVNHKHYEVFLEFWIEAFLLTIVLIGALQFERVPRPIDRNNLLRTVTMVLSIAILFFGAGNVFNEQFLDRLQPIWNAAQNAALKW